MDTNIEKECSALGGLFQAIVNDLKSSTPVWEDFLAKATKLHHALRATILAAGAFLDTFQKVADMATSTKGATRELGSALTRLCMRHRSIETKLKAFNTAIMDVMVNPMQEKMEDWKRHAGQLDKDHAKEYKKAKAEIKRASSDTIRLQKKFKKGKVDNSMQNKLDSALSDVNDKYLLLEETEKNAVRQALIEERSRFCLFISCLKPVVDEEIAMLTEVTHLQEIMDSLCMQASDPAGLPSASEQVILDIKGGDSWSFQMPDQSPPSSPSSLGSRKSSMCSISSLNSSSSGSSKSHSPSHHYRHRTPSQAIAGPVRLASVSSQDSGFMSQDTLYMQPPSPAHMGLHRKSSLQDSGSGTGTDSGGTTPSPSYPNATSASTWTNWPDPPNQTSQHQMNPAANYERPHTISSAYERHARPALTAQTFEPPDPHLLERPSCQTAPSTPSPYAIPCIIPPKGQIGRDNTHKIYESPQIYDSPKIYDTSGKIYATSPALKPRGKPVAPPIVPNFNQIPQDQMILPPTYVNMNELANLAIQKHRERLHSHPEENEHGIPPPQQPPPPQPYPGPASMMAMPPQSHYHNPHQMALLRQQQQQEAIYQQMRKTSRSTSLPPQQGPNSQELADAIRELEISTKELQMTYDDTDEQDGVNMEVVMNGRTVEKRSTRPANLPVGTREAITRQAITREAVIRQGSSGKLSKKPPLKPRPLSTAGMPQGGAPGLRRNSSYCGPMKPAPPVRRSSSITGVPPNTLPLIQALAEERDRREADQRGRGEQRGQDGQRSGSTTPTPQGSPEHQANGAPVDFVAMNSNANNVSVKTNFAIMETEDDDLPPPPPELLNPAVEHDPLIQHPGLHSIPPQQSVPRPPEQVIIQQGAPRTSRIGSISDSHASIMHNLNAQFACRTNPSSRPTDFPSEPAGISPQRRYSLDDSDITPTAEAPNSLMNQIVRGVKLRKTISHDRSAPKLK